MDLQKQIIGIIPARMASTRLPNKPLADICGKPLLQWVWEAASRSNTLQRVIIATDSADIVDLCFDIGAEFVETDSDLPSGTDRIKSAYDIIGESADIIVNIQGDEPLLTGEIIDNLILNFVKTKADVGTLIKKINNPDDIVDSSVVKVSFNSEMIAEIFSREPVIRFDNLPLENWLGKADYWKHIGIYAYKIEALNRFVSLPVAESEKKEKLEQLRLMENGAKYLCVETTAELIGVDTPEDLEKVKRIIESKIK